MASIDLSEKRRRAGQAGLRARWGDTPRVVRLDDLTAPQRRLVLALIAAARAERDLTEAARTDKAA
jgi:hypothetical protein